MRTEQENSVQLIAAHGQFCVNEFSSPNFLDGPGANIFTVNSPRTQKIPLPCSLIWTTQPKVPEENEERKFKKSDDSVRTNRGDPGVTQSNSGKVALDGPLLNGLKEKPRNILVKGIRGPASLPQQGGALPL